MQGNAPLSALVKKGFETKEVQLTDKDKLQLAQENSHLLLNLDRDDIGERLGGGLPRRSVVLLKGEYGTGKSIVCQRLLYGLLQNYHRATYISTELTVKGFLDQMFSVGYDVAPYLLKGQLHFYSLHQMMREGQALKDPLSKLEQAANLYTDEILIIDTLTSLAPSDLDLGRINRLLSFFKRIVATGMTVMVAVETGEINERNLLPFYCACEVLFETKLVKTPMGMVLFMDITRFAGAMNKVAANFAFRVESKIGIVPEITDMA